LKKHINVIFQSSIPKDGSIESQLTQIPPLRRWG